MYPENGFFLRFIALSVPFWHSAQKDTIRKMSLALICLTVLQIGVAVVITDWSADLFNALEQHSMAWLLRQIGLLVLIFICNIGLSAAHLTVKRYLQISWRKWLTTEVNARWMSQGSHYLVTHIDGQHDNPDGRIAEDIRIATEEAINLAHSFFYSLLLLFSFAIILWNLSGKIVLDLWLVQIPVSGYLVWLALVYAAGATAFGWLIGKPLVKATDARQTVEANFRYALVSAREHSQAIALIHGECNENKRFLQLFKKIADVFQLQTLAWRNILMFSSGYSVLSMAFPILVSAPRYIWGTITLGALMQSAQAFQHMAAALSWPVDNMAAVAQWRASAERVLGLTNALEKLAQAIDRPDPNRILLEKNAGASLHFENLQLTSVNGEALGEPLNAVINLGDRVLIKGDSAIAAKLFKAIAGLWPWGSGRIELPDDEPMFFMPPRPYLPAGSLCEAISYPTCTEPFATEQLVGLMQLVNLEDLIPLLDTQDTWEKSLSREQQQRLGVVRLLLHKPKWVLLQEALDSLSPENEVHMLRVIYNALPDVTLISITNQPSAEAFHDRRLNL